MVWTKLFKVNSFEKGLKPTKKLFHIDPLFHGKGLRQVKKVFKMVDLPFVWCQKEIMKENNIKSCYNNFPKKYDKREAERYEKIAKLRGALEISEVKGNKYRQERLDKRAMGGLYGDIVEFLPHLLKLEKQIKQVKPIDGAPSEEKRKFNSMVANHIKDIPKSKLIKFGRKEKEMTKNLMEDTIVDITKVEETNKEQQRESQLKRDQKKKEEEELKNRLKKERMENINRARQSEDEDEEQTKK